MPVLSPGLLSRLIRSRRVVYAIVGNGMASLASFALSVSIARSTSITVFGAFSIALVAYLFTSGLVRAGLTDTALARPDDPATHARSFQRASFIALLGAAVLIGWGWISGNYFLVVLGLSLHGLLALDFVRTYDSAVGRAARAAAATASWSILSISVSLLSLLITIDPLVLFATWAVGGAVCGYVLTFLVRAPLVPRWVRDRTDTRAAAAFAADYLVGSGGSLLTTGLLGFLDDFRIIGALRGAGTLLGPMNLISTTARSLMLPFLARQKADSNSQLKSAAGATVAQVLVLAPLLAALQMIPDSWGVQLLGETWQLAGLALLPLSIEAVFALVSAVAASGHRVAFAGKRTLILRVTLGVPRPVVVLLCAQTWGVLGAAWSMAAISVVNAAVWWASYVELARLNPGSPESAQSQESSGSPEVTSPKRDTE